MHANKQLFNSVKLNPYGNWKMPELIDLYFRKGPVHTSQMISKL